MPEEVMLSPEGYENLKKELEQLKGEERQKVADNIREAKSHGDLRENAMYHEARLNQTRLESRIAELERVLQHATVLDTEGEEGAIHLGSTVEMDDLQWGDSMTVILVGAFEADPTEDKISVSSPIGSALMGKTVGDEIEVETPGGLQKYRIKSVS